MTCQACGANITVAIDIDTGERVPLEPYEDSATDVPRYRVMGSTQPIRVQRVPQNAPGSFYPDHRFDCPNHPDHAAI